MRVMKFSSFSSPLRAALARQHGKWMSTSKGNDSRGGLKCGNWDYSINVVAFSLAHLFVRELFALNLKKEERETAAANEKWCKLPLIESYFKHFISCSRSMTLVKLITISLSLSLSLAYSIFSIKSPLFFEYISVFLSLARFSPSCVIDFRVTIIFLLLLK